METPNDLSLYSLSYNAGVRADSNGLEFNKISASANNHMPLSLDEWFGVYMAIPEIQQKIKAINDAVRQYVLKGVSEEEPKFENYERIISKKVAISVSVFKPQTRHFISVSIRSYFINPKGKLIFKKYPGVTFNQEEFNSLRCQANQINQYFCDLSASHNWHGSSAREYKDCRLCSSVERFYKKDQEEHSPVNMMTEFKVDCRNPADAIPAYRRIHQLIEKGAAGSSLTIIIKKHYNGIDFSLDETLATPLDKSKRSHDFEDDDDASFIQVAKKLCAESETNYPINRSYDIPQLSSTSPGSPSEAAPGTAAAAAAAAAGAAEGGALQHDETLAYKDGSPILSGEDRLLNGRPILSESSFRRGLEIKVENEPFIPAPPSSPDDTIDYQCPDPSAIPYPRCSTPLPPLI